MTGTASEWAEILSWVFLVANSGRILAYLPQMIAAWRCPIGARSVSVSTWSYFAFAHLTALLYAVYVLRDFRSAWIFAGNLAATTFLVVLIVWRRRQHRRRFAAEPSVIPLHGLQHPAAQTTTSAPFRG